MEGSSGIAYKLSPIPFWKRLTYIQELANSPDANGGLFEKSPRLLVHKVAIKRERALSPPGPNV